MPKYCLGLPLSETRPISPEESASLEALLSQACNRQLTLAALAWTAPVVLFAVISVSSDLPQAVTFGIAEKMYGGTGGSQPPPPALRR